MSHEDNVKKVLEKYPMPWKVALAEHAAIMADRDGNVIPVDIELTFIQNVIGHSNDNEYKITKLEITVEQYRKLVALYRRAMSDFFAQGTHLKDLNIKRNINHLEKELKL